MLFKIKNMWHESESESDYDTAVDLVHYHHSESHYILETNAGVKLELHTNTTHTSRSYLEPDFDHMEKTNETVYVQHTEENSHAEDTSYRHSVNVLEKIPAITREDLKLIEDLENKKIAYDSVEQDKLTHLWAYQAFLDGDYLNDDYNASVSLNDREIESLIEQINSIKGVKEGWRVELVLPEKAHKELLVLDNEQFNIMGINGQTRINNMCEQAYFNIDKALEKLTYQYLMNQPIHDENGVTPVENQSVSSARPKM